MIDVHVQPRHMSDQEMVDTETEEWKASKQCSNDDSYGDIIGQDYSTCHHADDPAHQHHSHFSRS